MLLIRWNLTVLNLHQVITFHLKQNEKLPILQHTHKNSFTISENELLNRDKIPNKTNFMALFDKITNIVNCRYANKLI